MIVCGRNPPSRWSWSSTFGAARISSSVGRVMCSSYAASAPDPREHEGFGRGRGIADLVRARERVTRVLDPIGVVDVQFEQYVAGPHRVARLLAAHDAGRLGDGVFLAGPPRAEAPRAHADRARVEAREHAV